MKIAIVGYGKMGHAVETAARQRGHEITKIIDASNQGDMQLLGPENTDAVIEFTGPEAATPNIRKLIQRKIPVICGSTGWYSELPVIKQEILKEDAAFLYASNFSIGVNVLFKLNQQLAELMKKYPEYDVFIEEQHHNRKKDAPSGTALTLAKGIFDHLGRKSKIAAAALLNRSPESDELSIGFSRAGNIVGKHTVTYTSATDKVEIKHEAYSREGFATGAVVAAEWMRDRKGFYTFSDLF